jgi:hypothetical protein
MADYDCNEHQLRSAHFIPLSFLTAALFHDNWFIISLIRVPATVCLSYFDMHCGFREGMGNYLTWIIGDNVIFILICYFSER